MREGDHLKYQKMYKKEVNWIQKFCSSKIIKSEIGNICSIRINIWSNSTKHLDTRRYINIWEREREKERVRKG